MTEVKIASRTCPDEFGRPRTFHYSLSIDGGCFGLFFAVFQSTRRFQMAAFLHSLHRFQAA